MCNWDKMTQKWDSYNEIFRRCHVYPLLFFIVLVWMGGLIFSFNRLTPLVVDDLLKIQGVWHLHQVVDWIPYLVHFYMTWGGRIGGEFFSLVFLSLPKSLYNWIGMLGYLLLVLLLYVNIVGRWTWSVFTFVFVNFSVWAFLPAFGQDLLWVTGAANYLWLSIIPLLFLYFLRLYGQKPMQWMTSWWMGIVLFVLAFLSGWSNEHISVMVFIAALGYMYLYKRKYNRMPKFIIASIIGIGIGCCFLWLAPGNFVRLGQPSSIGVIVNQMVGNALSILNYESTLPLLIVFVLLVPRVKEDSGLQNLAIIFLAGIILSSALIGVAVKIHSRLYFENTIFMIITSGWLIEYYFKEERKDTLLRFVLSVLLIGSIQLFFIEGRVAMAQYYHQWQQNEQLIQEDKNKGIDNIVINANYPKNRFCATYRLQNYVPDANNWMNKGAASYYQVKSIRTEYRQTEGGNAYYF